MATVSSRKRLASSSPTRIASIGIQSARRRAIVAADAGISMCLQASRQTDSRRSRNSSLESTAPRTYHGSWPVLSRILRVFCWIYSAVYVETLVRTGRYKAGLVIATGIIGYDHRTRQVCAEPHTVPGGGKHPRVAGGRRGVRAARSPVFGRQGLFRPVAPGAKGLLSGPAS